MNLKRIMIAAPKSGSGKTMVTCALLQTLKEEGCQAVGYKCGPDYIDPMFHERVIGIPSRNLDTFFTGAAETVRLLLKGRTEENFAVLEGVMGLFDGLGGIREEGSSYHLAKVTETPIVMVIDTKGMGRSLLPLIAGFLDYDKERLIKGIILNRMSKTFYETIKPLIEEELPISVLGYLPECGALSLESRHLGLVLPEELPDIKKRLRAVSEEFTKTVSVEAIVQIAEEAGELSNGAEPERQRSAGGNNGVKAYLGTISCGREAGTDEGKPVIAVARDEAFCFYYADNLLLLQEYGARIEYFSPLHDSRLPAPCHGLLIGGGYPELYAKELEDNNRIREEVKGAFRQGIPVVAECGGFMYLHSALVDKDGKSHAMAGAIPAACACAGRLVRFGYVEIEEKQSRFLSEGERIRGHEFHYYDSTDNGDSCLAVKPASGRTYSCIMEEDNHWLGFPHLYYPSNPAFAKAFVKKAEEYKKYQCESLNQ